MPLLELALDKIPSATRDVCAGALLSIIAWLYVKEATAYAIMVACTVGIGWLLVSLASVLSISLWIGVVVFVFICIVGASILYYVTPNGAKLKSATRDRIVASLIKSAPMLQKVLQAIEDFQFTSPAPPVERFQSMKDLRTGLVVEHRCGPGWTCYLCKVVRKGIGRGGQKVRIINSDGEWSDVYLRELSRASVDDIDRFRRVEAEKARQTKGKASKGPLKASHETLQVPDDSSLMHLVFSLKKLVSALGIKMSSSNRKRLKTSFSTTEGAICVIGCCITALDKALSIIMDRPRTFDKHLYKAVTKGPKGVAHLLKHARRLVEDALAFVVNPDQYAVVAKVPEQEVKPATSDNDDDLPKLLDGYTSSDDEEPTTDKCDAKASSITSSRPSRWRSLRKASSSAVSRALGSCRSMCCLGKPDVVAFGMPKAPDACVNCGKPGELSCCACGTTLCDDCSGLDQELIPDCKKKDKKRKNTMFICGRLGCPAGDEAGLRCARCSIHRNNDPSNDEAVVKPLARSTGVKCDETGRALNCVDSLDYRKLLPPCSNEGCPYGGLGDATTLKEKKELRKKRFEIDDVLVEVDTDLEARVVKAGNGLEVEVLFDGSETPETCAPYLCFDRKKVGGVLVDLDLPNLRCVKCKRKVGNEERDARIRVERTAMDKVRKNDGVQGPQRDRSTYHDWLTPDETDPERRNDDQKVADLYAKCVAAAKPLEEGEEDRVVVALKVGRPLSEDLVRGVFPELQEGSDKFEHLVRTIHHRLPSIGEAAETERPFPEGKLGPGPTKWFSSLEKLKDEISSKFTGLPLLVLIFMIPIFTAFLDDHFHLWRTATRYVKHNNRKQAAGMMGFFYTLLVALRLTPASAWTVPLELLGTFLMAIDFIGDGTAGRNGDGIYCTHYTARFLAIGVRLRLVSMLYSLNVASVCLVCISGAAIIAAGCQFGEIRTLSALNGCTAVKGPGEDRVGDTHVNRRSRGECNGVAYALEKPNYCPDGGDIYTMTVRRSLGTKHAFVSAGDDLPPDYETYDSITFGIAGTDEEHFSSCFVYVYENKIGRYLNGVPSGDGRSMLAAYRRFNGCNGSCGGYPFCLGKRDPSGTFDESRRYCGVRRGDWVEDIGRDIKSLLLEAKILCRANKAHRLLYSKDGEYDPMSSGLGGDPEYARRGEWVDGTARTLRWKIQSTLGQHAADARALFMFCFSPYMMAPIDAANADHAGARALGEANNIPGMRDRIAGVTVAIGEGATYLKQRLNEANGDWSAVVVDARRELHAIAAPHLQMLPDDPFKCAVALKELDATVARKLATRRATSTMDVSGDAPRESTPPSSTRSLDPAPASPLDSPIPAGALPTVAAVPRASSDVRSPPRKKQWRGRSDAAPAQPPAAQTAPGPTPAAPAQLQAQATAAAAATPAATAPSAATSPNPAAWAWRSASGG